MVNTLQFNMSVPTPYVFMRRFLKAADSDKKVCITFFTMKELNHYQLLVAEERKKKGIVVNLQFSFFFSAGAPFLLNH